MNRDKEKQIEKENIAKGDTLFLREKMPKIGRIKEEKKKGDWIQESEQIKLRNYEKD